MIFVEVNEHGKNSTRKQNVFAANMFIHSLNAYGKSPLFCANFVVPVVFVLPSCSTNKPRCTRAFNVHVGIASVGTSVLIHSHFCSCLKGGGRPVTRLIFVPMTFDYSCVSTRTEFKMERGIIYWNINVNSKLPFEAPKTSIFALKPNSYL